MKASLSAVIAALESAAIALSVFAVLGLTGFLLWWFTFELAAEPEAVLSGISAVWMLSHFVPITFTVPSELLVAYGIPSEASSFVLSFVPLGLTAITVLLAMRLGARAGHRGGSGLASVCGAVVGFGGATLVISLLAKPFLLGSAWEAVLPPILMFIVAVGIGFLWSAITDPHDWWEALSLKTLKLVQRGMPGLAAVLPNLLREVCRIVGAMLGLLVALGAFAVFVSLVVGYVEVISLSQALQLTAFGIFVLFLLHLAVLPVAVIWAISWFTGIGFQLGEGNTFSPFFTTEVALPAVPIVGALPTEWGSAGALAPAIIVCLSIVVGAMHAGSVRLKRQTTVMATLVPVVAAVVVGVLGGLAAMLTGGSFGPGLFSSSGVSNWVFAGVLAAECAFGLLLGTWGRRAEMHFRAQAERSTFSDEAESESSVFIAASSDQPTAQSTVFSESLPSPGSVSQPTLQTHDSDTFEHSTEALIRQYAWSPDDGDNKRLGSELPLTGNSADETVKIVATEGNGAPFVSSAFPGEPSEMLEIKNPSVREKASAIARGLSSRLTSKWKKGNKTD